MIFNKRDSDTKQRFGIRKLTIGACSVLLSTLFLTVNNNQTVHASEKDAQPSDETTQNTQEESTKPNAPLTLSQTNKHNDVDKTQQGDEAETNTNQSDSSQNQITAPSVSKADVASNQTTQEINAKTDADSNVVANSALSASLVEEGSHANNTSEAITPRTTANQATASTRATTNQQPDPEVISQFGNNRGLGLVLEGSDLLDKAANFLSNSAAIEAAGGTISWESTPQAPVQGQINTATIKIDYGNNNVKTAVVKYQGLRKNTAQTFSNGTSFYYVSDVNEPIDVNKVDSNNTSIVNNSAANTLLSNTDAIGKSVDVQLISADTSKVGFSTAKLEVTDTTGSFSNENNQYYIIGGSYTVDVPIIVKTLAQFSNSPVINAQLTQDGKTSNAAPNLAFQTSDNVDSFSNNGQAFGRYVYQDYLKYYALGGRMSTDHTSLGTVDNPVTSVKFDLLSLKNADPVNLKINWIKPDRNANGTKDVYYFWPDGTAIGGIKSYIQGLLNNSNEIPNFSGINNEYGIPAVSISPLGGLPTIGKFGLKFTATYNGLNNGIPDILSNQSIKLTADQYNAILSLNSYVNGHVTWGSNISTAYTPTIYNFNDTVYMLNTPDSISKSVDVGTNVTSSSLIPDLTASYGRTANLKKTIDWPEGTKFDLVDDNGNPISAIEMNTPDATKTVKVKITLPTGVSTLVDVNLKTNPLADNQREVQLQYEYTDANGNVKIINGPVKVGTINDLITFDNIAVPESLKDKYDLPAGQGSTISAIVTPSSPQTVMIPLVHKTTTQTEYDTREATVKFLYGGDVTDPDGNIIGEDGDTAKPAAILDIYYKKTTTTDLVTGKTTGGTWQFDSSMNDDGYKNGYKVVSGDWTLPTDGSNIKVAVPTVDYCTAWTKTSQTDIPTNEFVAPNETSFTSEATAYEAQAVHTVWYLPIETQYRALTENFIYWDDVDNRDRQVQAPAKLYVYYKREATNFDEESHEITYGDWSWDTSQGDSKTPGFRVMNGKWSLPSPDDRQATISVALPTVDGYTAVTHVAGNTYNSTTFANPYANPNAFINNTDSNWTYRKTLTTYYIPTKNLTKTITRTIIFDDDDSPLQDQTVTFKRVARLNSNDDGIIYGAEIDGDPNRFEEGRDQYNHSSDVENASGTWEAYDVKRAGYTALYAIGDDDEYTQLATNTIPEVTVTPTTQNTSLTIKYIKNKATVNFSGNVTHTYSGSSVTLSSDDIRQLSYSLRKANINCYLPEELNNVSFTADDFSFANNEGQVIDAPTNVGTYRIILNDHGINTLKEAAEQYTAGYEFSYDPSKQYATYEITPAKASAKLTGTQPETYTGNVINTLSSDINLTITADPSLSYTLQAGDYEFTQNGEIVTPENAGTYDIQLTQAGIDHIKSLGTGNYNWVDITSTAQLVIKKATASYKLSGSQSETYKGSTYTDTDLIPAKYSINITTNNGQTLTYTLQSGDIAFLTGENPTNKGTYQVGLTEAGLEHLKAINANFDWDTDVSTSTATFEITAQQMIVNIAGEASAIFDNQAQGIPNDQINNIHYTWNSSPTKPSEISSSELNANDFEYYEKDTDGNWKLITDNGGLPLHAGKYGVKLKDSVIAALNSSNANGNYTFKNGDNISTIFTINQRKVRVTLDGSQSAQYTKNGELDVANFTVKLTDTATGNPITVGAANLAPGDLLIKGYDQNGYPKLVGNYDVKMTSAFIKKLEELYPDYQFTSDEVMPNTSAQSENNDPITNSGNTDVTDQNNNGKYIITPLAAEATLTGGQTIKYGQANNIDYSQYSVSLTSNGQPLKDADGHEVTYTLKDGDLKFETEPGNVGDYKVVLSDQGIANLKKLGLNPTIADQNDPEYPSSGTDNYEWSNFTNNTNFVVTAMPVTIAVANGSNGPQTSIYGNQISINPDKYTITLTTDDGSTLDYTLQAGDLSFKNGTPTSTGTFDLELSQQGLTNIEQKFNSSAKNYKFNAPTSTATYVVKAATPTITIKANGNEQKTYNGQPVAINSGDYTITITSDAHQYQIGDLDGSSLQFKDNTAPTNVGTYQVELTPDAINKLKSDYPNFDWDDAVKTVGQYTIVAGKASAELSGQNSMTYNGQTVTTADLNKDGTIKVTISIDGMTQTINYKLQDGDYSWDAGQAPVNANDTAYLLSLNKDSVLANLQDAINEKFGKGQNNQPNVTISADALSGKAEFTINKAQANVTLAGTQPETYTGSVPTINPGKFTITLGNGKTYTLQAGDLQYVNTATDANKGVGSWQVELTQQGKENIEAVDSNYNYSFAGNGNVVISKAVVTQDEIKFSGDAEKTFDGTPIANYKPTVTITAPGAAPITLDANDYKFVSGDKEFTTAPSNAGKYQVKLTETGIQKITANNSANLDWSKLDLTKPIGTYTINPFAVTVTTTGQTTVNSGTTTIPNNVYGLSVSANGQMPTGWSGIQTADANFGFDGNAPTADTKSGIFTVNYIGGRAALQNLLGDNYKVTYTPTKDNFIVQDTTPTQGQQVVQYVDQNGTVITSHTVEGDEGSQASFNVGNNVPENWQLVNPNDANAQITIAGGTTQFKVEHKLQDLADDTKTVTRTIIEHIPGASQPTTQTQSFKFTRTAKKDLVTDEIIYGNWNAESHTFASVTPQTANGYTASPSQVSELLVTPNSGNTTVDVYYTQDPVQGQQVIRFVDSDGHVVKTVGTVTGTDGENVSVANLNLAGQIPTNWKLADGQELPTSVIISGGYTDIKIVHDTVTQTSSKTVTRIINVTAPDGNTTPTKQEAKFTKTDTVDLVTGEVVTPGQWQLDSNGWIVFTTPTITGYTPTQASVPAVTPTKDQIINITYTANTQTSSVIFVDDDEKVNGEPTQVSEVPISGKTNQTIVLNLSVPENYELANGQTLPKNYKFEAEDNEPIVIHLVHKLEGTVDTKTVTRTIIMNLPNGAKPQVVQNAELSRTATKDLVTGKVTYGKWSTGKWDAFTPEAVDDYTANPASVPAVQVNEQTADTTVEINYTKNGDGGDKPEPTPPTEPTTPPEVPTEPTQPSKPVNPVQPTKPVKPTPQPTKPDAKPDKKPNKPVKPNKPNKGKPTKPNKTKHPKNHNVKPNKYNKNNSPRYEDKNRRFRGQHNASLLMHNRGFKDSSIGASRMNNQGSKANELPQTGQKDTSFLAAIGSLFASLSLFGLAKRRKKDQDDE